MRSCLRNNQSCGKAGGVYSGYGYCNYMGIAGSCFQLLGYMAACNVPALVLFLVFVVI